MGYAQCPYWDCPNRTEFGYCMTTACINYKYQFNTYRTTDRTSIDPESNYYSTNCTEESNDK